MEQEKITIQSLTTQQDFAVDYYNDDLVIIDNVKKLAEPSAARLAMNILVVCVEGKAQVDMNGSPIVLEKNQVLLCPPNVTFSDFMISPAFEFKALFLTNRILQSFLRDKISIWNETLYIHKMHVVTLDDTDIVYYQHIYELLRLCLDSPLQNPYQNDVIMALLRGAIIGLCGRLKQTLPDHQSLAIRQPNSLFQQFLDLLGSTTKKHQPVEYYASELCVTPKYLSSVCKKQSGKTANEWITEQVTEDIRYYLRQTDYTIKHICDILGFPNPSFFGKYVKGHFGMPPIRFREKSS